MSKVKSHKAYVAGGSSGVLALVVALLSGGDVDWRGLLSAAVAGAVTGGLTWAKANPPKRPRPEGGAVSVQTVVYVLAAAVLIVLLFLLTPLNWGHG